MLIGYALVIQDNDEFLIKDMKKIPEALQYKNSYAFEDWPVDFRIKKRKVDIGYTYDGFLVVSENLKSRLLENGFTGLEFLSIPSDDAFFILRVHNIIEYNALPGQVRFNKFSRKYNEYLWVHGAYPVYIKHNDQQIHENNIYRSDLFFGEGIKRSPVLMVGIKTRDLLNSWELKGLTFEKILSEYPSRQKKEKPKGFFQKLFKK
jgi:hypothetical protein